MKDFERGMRLLDLPPMVKLDPDGTDILVDAIRKQACRDYIKATRFVMTRAKGVPYFTKAKEDAQECRIFLGDGLCDEMDRLIQQEIAEGLYG